MSKNNDLTFGAVKFSEHLIIPSFWVMAGTPLR